MRALNGSGLIPDLYGSRQPKNEDKVTVITRNRCHNTCNGERSEFPDLVLVKAKPRAQPFNNRSLHQHSFFPHAESRNVTGLRQL